MHITTLYRISLTVSPSTGSMLTSDGDNITLESGDIPLYKKYIMYTS